MTPDELRAQIKVLYLDHTAAEIAELCDCRTQRVRNLANRSGMKCMVVLGYIGKHHARIVELSKTKTPAQIAWELGISRKQLYSYNQNHGIRCKPAASAKVINYTSIRSKVMGTGPNEKESTLNIIRRHYRPVYAENTAKRTGKGINFTGRYVIGDRLIVNGYEAVEALAAVL